MGDLRGFSSYTLCRWLATGLVAGILLFFGPARANDYGLFIEIETEEDLLDLLSSQELDESEFETLVELLNDGVDLSSASRDELYALPNLTYAHVDAILAYRDEAGHIDDPLTLVTANVLPEREFLAIVPFLLVQVRDPDLFATKGRFRYQTTFVAGDSDVPSMWLSGKVSTLKNLDVGLVGLVTRSRISDVVFDPNRDALSAKEADLQVHVPKFFLQWETKKLHVVVGTYRIGFGQRLTFDNTTWYTPNGIKVDETVNYNQDLTRECKESVGELAGSPCGGEARYEYASPDYKWTDRFRGAAVGLKHLELGDGWLQAYGWFSHQTRSIYQYEIYDRRQCDDPLDDDDPACKAPDVYVRLPDLLTSANRFAYQTLPDMFNELLGGANVAYFFDRRSHLGVTGFGADISWLVKGMDLDFQEWSRLPYGGSFGAVGIDGSIGLNVIDLAGEFTRTFDGQPAGGGFAALLRATATWKKHEFEGVVRYYDKNFANPYARPISAPDEYDGLRARDEAGLRLRYTGKIGDLRLRATNDFWTQLSAEAPKLEFQLRADYELEQFFIPGVWFKFQDRDLSEGGRTGTCFETAFDDPLTDEPELCTGEKLQAGVQARFVPVRDLSITAKYVHKWLDDVKDTFDGEFRQDASAWLVIMFKPMDDLRLRFRLRYLYEAIGEDDYLEHSVWGYLEAAYWYERTLRFKLRYEIYDRLDDRESTIQRDPNPAHWLRLELEYRF